MQCGGGACLLYARTEYTEIDLQNQAVGQLTVIYSQRNSKSIH